MFRSEFNPSAYLEFLLNGTDGSGARTVNSEMTPHTPSPTQLEADAAHILTQLANRIIRETAGEEGAVPSLPPPPSHTTRMDLVLANPWSILQSLLFSLHSLVWALVQQGRVDLARYYINHGLLASSQYALRHWYVGAGMGVWVWMWVNTLMICFLPAHWCRLCQFLLHLIHLKQLCGEFDDNQCHLSTVSQLLHLHSKKEVLDHEGSRHMHGLDHSPDVSSRSLVGQYTRLYTQWCLNKGVPEKADKMIGQFEAPGSKNIDERRVQCVWKDILTLLKRVSSPCVGHVSGSSEKHTESPLQLAESSCSKTVRTGKKQVTHTSASLCTTKELSCLLALSRCDLYLASQAWDQLVAFADAALQQDAASCTPALAAQFHFAQGVGLFHQQQQNHPPSVTSTKKTSAPKTQRTRKKKGVVGAGRVQASPTLSTPPAIEPHVVAFLKAHALCSTEIPAVLMREVCRWLSACVIDDTGRLPALFLTQSSGVSVYHRLVGKSHSTVDQNVNTGVSGLALG